MISKGSLEGVYPGLIMANGARMEGLEANLFFTFFGLDAITRKRQAHIKVATVGNPGMHLPTILGAIPGMSWVATKMMARKMEKLDIPPVPEFVEMIADSGAGIYACKATVDMFGLSARGLRFAGHRRAHRRRVLRERGGRRDRLHLNGTTAPWACGSHLRLERLARSLAFPHRRRGTLEERERALSARPRARADRGAPVEVPERRGQP